MSPADAAASSSMVGPNGETMRMDASDAWAARPDFTHVTSETEEAYAYALFHPGVIAWMPCYCGCEAMEHRSNLDCYLKAQLAAGKIQFEEHASFCDVCVKTTLMAKQMAAAGKSLREIRDAIDGAFGASAPGTRTALPPA